jgi:replicative DNA helicase
MISNERLILSALVKNERFMRAVSPFIKAEFFRDQTEKRVFELVADYVAKYNSPPNKSSLGILVTNDQEMNEKQTVEAADIVADIFDIIPPANDEFLSKTTEEWCKNQSVHNAIDMAISVYQGENNTLTVNAIPDLLRDAIGMSFDVKIGLDFDDDAQVRWDYYTTPENKIPFDLDIMNEVTCGGVTRKTLNVLTAGVNVGKTMSLIHLASAYKQAGYNVLYFSLEMREEAIMQRMDANILKTAVNDIVGLGQERYLSRIEQMRAKTHGKLKVKEFPPGSASASHFRHTVNELKLKQNFVADIIIVDYLTICASARMKYGVQGSYFYYKAVAEELRALAVEENVVIWTAAQFNRGGMSATEVGMEDLAESVGIAQTVDGMWAVIRTDELDQVGQLMIKQLKSRYANKAVKTRFTIGVNIDTQTLFDVTQSQQTDIIQPEKLRVPSNEELKNRFLGIKVSGED